MSLAFSRVFALCLLIVLLGLSGPARAQDFRVTLGADQYDGVCDAHCSLRDAVSSANQAGGDNRILLFADTYRLTLPPDTGDEGFIFDEDANLNGDLDLLGGSLSILGLGAGVSIIDGSSIDRLLEVLPGASLRVQDLTLRNGFTSTSGGAIDNAGRLLVRRCALLNNNANFGFGGGEGGALSNRGVLQVYNSSFIGNSASFGDSGHAFGGAIFNSGTLEVSDSLFRDNAAHTDDVVALGGALFNAGSAVVTRSSFLHHAAHGPGITIRNDGTGNLVLSNVTVSGKSTTGEFDGDAIVANGSSFPMFGGRPHLSLINVTIADNLTLGLLNYGDLEVRNSLIAGNGNDFLGASNCSNGGSDYHYLERDLLLGIDTGNCTAELYVENALTFTQVLKALADNNSTLPTHALRPGSPAVDAVHGLCSTTQDQRGSLRPRDGDGDGVAVCDLGAYERGPRVR